MIAHLFRRKGLYEVLGVLLALIFSATALLISIQTLSIQNRESEIRTRPYLTIKRPNFAGPLTVREGVYFLHSAKFILENISDVPAFRTEGRIEIFANGQSQGGVHTHETVLMKGEPKTMEVQIQEDLYEAAVSGATELSIEASILYYGVGGEATTPYRTTLLAFYYPNEKVFRARNMTME